MKKILSFIAMGVAILSLILYIFAPILEVYAYDMSMSVKDAIKDGEMVFMIVVTIIFIIITIAGAALTAVKGLKPMGFVSAGVALLTAIFCFSAKGFILTDWGMEDYDFLYDLGAGGIWSGILLIIAGILLVVSAVVDQKSAVNVPVSVSTSNGSNAPNVTNADDKQNNLIRFLLTFFLGWIGSLIINYTSFKPRGFKSRTLAYFFLTGITLGIYGLVASICNLSFDPAKASNIGYFRDGSEAYMPAPTQANTAQQAQTDIDKQLKQMQTLQDLLDKGIITQEDFNAKKKDILGL